MTTTRQSLAAVALLAIAIAAGAFLRLESLGAPSYWLDEILHEQLTENEMHQPLWRWITGFSAEHGPLYYLTQLTTHRWHSEFAGRLPAALLGILAIALVWLAARPVKDLGWLAAPASAAFIALSPLHVYYSREARAYSLLMFLTAALIASLVRARTAVVPSIVLVAIFYTTAAAAPLIGAAFVVTVIAAFFSESPARRRFATIAAVSAATLACMPLLYASRPVEDASWPGFPDVDWLFVFGIVRAFSVTALDAPIAGTAAILILLAVIGGAVAVMARGRITGVIVIGMTVLPLAFSLAALHFLDHFYAVRYVTPAVVGFTILAGVGVAATAAKLARRASHWADRGAFLFVVVVLAAFATQMWPAARTEAFQKLDWRAIAQALRNHVHPGDVILAAEPWSEVSLRYYLGEIAGVKLIHMRGPGIAQLVADQSPAAWLVTAGATADPSVRQWMCRYPVLLSSPLEGFRLHYAPSLQHFLRARSGPEEQRAASAALGDRGFTLRMGAEDDIVIGSGWAQLEGSPGDAFRWAIGRRATLLFPRYGRRDRTIRFHALPLADPALPPQNVHVSLNGHAIGVVALAPKWSDYAVNAAAAFWIDGLNTLTFDFDRANAPASADRRELAAAFRRISIDDTGFDSNAVRRDRELVPAMRIALLAPLVPGETRFPVAQLRRASVEALLGRLGIDPVTGWTKIASGEVRLEDAAETIAFGSDCEDDDAFLRRAFAIIVERKPNEIEQRDLLRRLHNGATREHVIGRIMKLGDFIRIYRESRPSP
jgi:mannosyltransferase